jgi:hypothetical protein
MMHDHTNVQFVHTQQTDIHIHWFMKISQVALSI